jgi:hypothetical protein
MAVRGNRVLIVESERLVRDVVAERLESAGYQGEDVPGRASASDLLGYYSGTGKPVIALRVGTDLLCRFDVDRVRPLSWPPDSDDLLELIGELTAVPAQGE